MTLIRRLIEMKSLIDRQRACGVVVDDILEGNISKTADSCEALNLQLFMGIHSVVLLIDLDE